MLKQFDDFDLDIQKMSASYDTIEVGRNSAIERGINTGRCIGTISGCSHIIGAGACDPTFRPSMEVACR